MDIFTDKVHRYKVVTFFIKIIIFYLVLINSSNYGLRKNYNLYSNFEHIPNEGESKAIPTTLARHHQLDLDWGRGGVPRGIRAR